ncbi:hypothetical protein rosag_15010 [Roseisolibacter agri]|uniref:Uncharacterized protein n=1 Tax=Roseisolibacter agri TaxID=2014610 RepID=A0AA37VA18_9BACT|nr:hypothetical protein rosag_15010 [Roseisolibacter agri]
MVIAPTIGATAARAASIGLPVVESGGVMAGVGVGVGAMRAVVSVAGGVAAGVGVGVWVCAGARVVRAGRGASFVTRGTTSPPTLRVTRRVLSRARSRAARLVSWVARVVSVELGGWARAGMAPPASTAANATMLHGASPVRMRTSSA